MVYIIPTALVGALNKRLDEEITKHPEAARDRDIFYRQLLDYVNEHGIVPDFSLVRRALEADKGRT